MSPNPNGSLAQKERWMRERQARKAWTDSLIREMRALSRRVTDRNMQRVQALLDAARKERKRA